MYLYIVCFNSFAFISVEYLAKDILAFIRISISSVDLIYLYLCVKHGFQVIPLCNKAAWGCP